jgi:hypothetical protein
MLALNERDGAFLPEQQVDSAFFVSPLLEQQFVDRANDLVRGQLIAQQCTQAAVEAWDQLTRPDI